MISETVFVVSGATLVGFLTILGSVYFAPAVVTLPVKVTETKAGFNFTDQQHLRVEIDNVTIDGGTIEVRDLDASTDSVRMFGYDGSTARVFKTDSNGRPEIVLAGTQSVAISGTPTVTVASGQSIAISNSPEVTIASGQSVAISGTPAVTFSGTQSVAITGTLPGTEGTTAKTGDAGSVKPVLGGGLQSDGSTLRALLTDTLGRLTIVVDSIPSVAISTGQSVQTVGTTADGDDGSAVNPVLVGGTESDGTLQGIRVDSDGHAQVEVVNTPTVSFAGGTVTGTVATGSDASSVDPVMMGGIDVSSAARTLKTDRSGNLRVQSVDTESNPIHGVRYRPMVSGTGLYDFVPSNFRTNVEGTGVADAIDPFLVVSTGGTADGASAAIKSFRTITAHSNEMVTCTFSAYFTGATTNLEMGAGFTGRGHELSFGYDGTAFGVWHRHGGRAEIREATVTTAGTSPNIDITINNEVLGTLAATGSTSTQIASEIAAHITSETSAVSVDQIDDRVAIVFETYGAKSGTFSITGDGGFVSSGWSQTTAGVATTNDHVPVASWDNQNLGFTLDPTTGNNYKIMYRSGFGACEYFVEDPNDINGRYVLVHTIHGGNTGTTLLAENPASKVELYATNVDVTAGTGSVTVFDIAAGITAGDTHLRTRNPRAYSNTVTIDTTLTNLFTIRNVNTYGTRANSVSIIPCMLTLANDGTKSAVFELRGDPTVSGITEFTTVSNDLVSLVDTAGVTVASDGRPLAYFAVSKGQSLNVDLSTTQIVVPPGLRLVVAARMTSGSAADLTAALTWYEDL